jgi:Holliday junction resolvase RusA-like endonuclease
MILIEISGDPVPWAAHRGYGKRAFNPRKEQREKYQWQIKAQYNQLDPLSGPLKVDYTYFVGIPKSTSKIRRMQMLNGKMHPITRPDIDNYDKFLSDCLTDIVWQDDSQVIEKMSRKIYGEREKTIIRIEALYG